MRPLPELLRFLILSALLSFCAPVVSLTALLATVSAASCVPCLRSLGMAGRSSLVSFLATFGTGCPLSGLIAIGTASAVAGCLFAAATVYRSQQMYDPPLAGHKSRH